jgi:hypothetical protein
MVTYRRPRGRYTFTNRWEAFDDTGRFLGTVIKFTYGTTTEWVALSPVTADRVGRPATTRATATRALTAA